MKSQLPSHDRFAFILSMLVVFLFQLALWRLWPDAPEGSWEDYAREWAFFPLSLAVFYGGRALFQWRNAPSGEEKRLAVRSGAASLVLLAIYLATVAAGVAILWAIDLYILQKWPFWARFAVVVPLGFPTFFGFALLGLWLGGKVKGWLSPRDKSRIETREIALPDAESLRQFSLPLRLRSNQKFLGWVGVLAALMGALALVACASQIAVGDFQTSLVTASLGLWMSLGALFSWFQSRSPGQISDSMLQPRLGRAFEWGQVAKIEEICTHNLFGEGQQRVLSFQNSAGKSLWNLSLDEIDERDLQNLLSLLQVAATSFCGSAAT